MARGETLRAEAGEVYRWTLRREGHEPLYVTLNSPELPEMAHLIVTDPEMLVADPIVSRIMRTEPEVLMALHDIREMLTGGTMGDSSFRERARRQFEVAFGPALVLPTEAGALYRWVLARPAGQSLYITLDSPEMPHIAHVLVSDPQSTQLDPISSLVMRTEAEVASAIARSKQQHQGVPEAERK